MDPIPVTPAYRASIIHATAGKSKIHSNCRNWNLLDENEFRSIESSRVFSSLSIHWILCNGSIRQIHLKGATTFSDITNSTNLIPSQFKIQNEAIFRIKMFTGVTSVRMTEQLNIESKVETLKTHLSLLPYDQKYQKDTNKSLKGTYLSANFTL